MVLDRVGLEIKQLFLRDLIARVTSLVDRAAGSRNDQSQHALVDGISRTRRETSERRDHWEEGHNIENKRSPVLT